MKKTKPPSEKSRLSSPARPLNRPRPAETPSQGSGRRTKASTSSRKSDSSYLTPTRSSTRKCRPTAKAAIEDTSDSDSDCTPPPSIISSSPMKRSSPEKRASRKRSNEKEAVAESDVIDLTVPQTLSPKSPRKRPKVDRRPTPNLDTFINLCSDEEMNPQPRKKRKFIPANDVIFISSGDESELPRRQLWTAPSLEHAAEAQISKKGHVAGHSAGNAESVAPDTSHEMVNNLDVSTPPPVSPLETDSPESVIVDITASENMTGIEEISTPRISRKLLDDLYQESLQKSPVNSLTSEASCSTSFCNTPSPAIKQRAHRVVHKQAKRALLTSLIFARPMRSLGTTSRPKVNVNPQRPKSSKAVDSSVKETKSLDKDDTFQQIVLDILRSSAVSPPLPTDTLRVADTGAMNADTPDEFLDATTHEDLRVLSPIPLMEVNEIEVEPVFSEGTGDDRSKDPVPFFCSDESSAQDVLAMEIVGECGMMEIHDTSTPHEGQADDHLAEASFTESEPMQIYEIQVHSGVAECVLRTDTSPERVGEITIPSCATTSESCSYSAAQADELVILPDTSRVPSPAVYGNDSVDDTLGNSLPRETSPNPQTYINSSIFELEHLPDLTFQILYTSNRVVDDVSDLAISLPCYPEELHY